MMKGFRFVWLAVVLLVPMGTVRGGEKYKVVNTARTEYTIVNNAPPMIAPVVPVMIPPVVPILAPPVVTYGFPVAAGYESCATGSCSASMTQRTTVRSRGFFRLR